ncbi:alpha/beta hydrolase [Actinomyces israelii]|uniref:alpha/beta hydrolase n=1 Tax=Actinomyces israelii TaxID=1659 RepID=UPI0005B85C51|nr:alpha/beta hydrolase [Actinomyces israelii]
MTSAWRFCLRRPAAALAALSLCAALTACRPGPAGPDGAHDESGPPGAQTGSDPSAGDPAAGGSPDSPSGGAPAGLETFYDQELSWADCADGADGYQCATATVPLSYDDPDGETISIALRRLPASDGTAELGSLFLNPGGPGGSGTGMVATAAASYTPEMLASYDLVGFDPRGVGDSTRLTCWDADEVAQSGGVAGDAAPPGGSVDDGAAPAPASGISAVPAADPSPVPEETEASPTPDATAPPTAGAETPPSGDATATPKIDGIFWTSTAAKGTADANACRTYSEVGGLIDHMGRFDVARDLDVLRSAVGDERLSYLGYSYGTVIGSAYAELFPGSVGRVILDSAQDPALTRTEVADTQLTYREGRARAYLESCLGQAGCPLTGTVDDAVSQLIAFFKGLGTEPLTITQTDGRTGRMDAATAFNHAQNLWLARPEYWPALTRALSQAMSRHDGTELARVGALAPGAGQISKPASQQEASYAMTYTAVICADSPDVADQATWNAEAAKSAEDYPLMNAMGSLPAGTDAYCHGWGVTASSAPAEVHASGSAPILVVGVDGDSQTPYSWARSLASQLDAGHLLTVEGYEHGASLSNTCAVSRVSDYLVDGALPDEGASCPIDPLPADVAEGLAK